jgi:hypothetical protein
MDMGMRMAIKMHSLEAMNMNVATGWWLLPLTLSGPSGRLE